MATNTIYKSLTKPLRSEKYSVNVFNNNADIIDAELHKLEIKNQEQDNTLLATKTELNSQISDLNNVINTKANQSDLNNHVNDKSNPHKITKSQIGLENVENKSSLDILNELTQDNVINALGFVPYTPTEVDNKFSALETNIDWKEAVNTFNDIETTYPEPEDGWTVNVKDTDYTYRYNGEEWVVISANAIPKATDEVDGLLSREDHVKYDDANDKKHMHDNKEILDEITSVQIEDWNNASYGLKINNQNVYLDYQDGKYGINTDPERGADTFVPFRSDEDEGESNSGDGNLNQLNFGSTSFSIFSASLAVTSTTINLASLTDKWQSLEVGKSIFVNVTSIIIKANSSLSNTNSYNKSLSLINGNGMGSYNNETGVLTITNGNSVYGVHGNVYYLI